MKTYNSYHTCIKQLARSNSLPHRYADGIDRSTLWRWRQESEDKYQGVELSNIQVLQQFLERQESEKLIKSYLKIALAFSNIFRKTNQFQKFLSQNKDSFVRTILRYGKGIKISFILRVMNISNSVYFYWKNQVLYPCKTSALKLCRRIYPNQLTSTEMTLLKSLATSADFKYWPVSSIAHYARKNNILHISLASWYNYIHKLGIKRPVLTRKPIHKIGIRANRPHQIWHADITIVKCLNGIKYYVYFLMDNYSRFILNYQVSERVSAKIRLGSIRQAYRDYINNKENNTTLLVDGGSENNNYLIDRYFISKGKYLRKLIAGKDIHFSNSMVEAQNKLIKYHYLFKHPFHDIHDLKKLLDWIIQDYNHRRPHHSLGGQTPFEALTEATLPVEEWKKQMKKAKQVRIKANTANTCGIC